MKTDFHQIYFQSKFVFIKLRQLILESQNKFSERGPLTEMHLEVEKGTGNITFVIKRLITKWK